jgi:HSP20 family protein
MGKRNAVQLMSRPTTALMKSENHAGTLVVPSTDVLETEDAFLIRMDLPGTTRESIQLSIAAGELIVNAPVRRGADDGSAVLLHEIGRKTYVRTFRLTEGLDLPAIDAVFEDGVLTITLPKREELKRRNIPIN